MESTPLTESSIFCPFSSMKEIAIWYLDSGVVELFISDVIEVSPSDKELLESNKDKLAKYGYEIDFTSDKELIFRKIPQILSKIPPKEILADILENMHGDIDGIEERILITTSCKAAVKANTYLNQYQMEESE